jgi:hypothetical protein
MAVRGCLKCRRSIRKINAIHEEKRHSNFRWWPHEDKFRNIMDVDRPGDARHEISKRNNEVAE